MLYQFYKNEIAIIKIGQMIKKHLNMKMDAHKSKVLICNRENNVQTKIKSKDDKTIKQVEYFIYLAVAL